jgi:hypothetical protein
MLLFDRAIVRRELGDALAANEDLDQALELFSGVGFFESNARLLEQQSVKARDLGFDAAACWIDLRTYELYRENGDRAGAEDLLSIMDDFGC